MAANIVTTTAVYLDNTSGTLADISGQVVSATLTPTVMAGSYFTLGSTDENATSGKLPRKFDITLNIIKTDTADEAYDILETWVTGSSVDLKTFELYYPDNTSGSTKYTGECMLMTAPRLLDANAASGDVMRMSATLKVSGGITKSTVV